MSRVILRLAPPQRIVLGNGGHATIGLVQGPRGPQGPKGDPGNGSVDSVNGYLGPVIELDAADVGAATTAQGERADSAVQGDDPRLSDARTPLPHTHPVGDLATTGTKSSTTFLRGDGVWAPPPSGGGGSSLIGFRSYVPTDLVGYSTSNTTLTAVDMTNLTATFTAPGSGTVLVRLEATMAAASNPNNNYAGWGVLIGGSRPAGTTIASVTTSTSYVRVTATFRVTSLTSGTTYTVAWAHASPYGGTASLTCTPQNPATMEVWSA